MLPENIIWVGVVINLAGSLWYLKNIIWGNTKPNLVSWSIWTLAPFIGVFFQIKAGAGLSILSVFMAGFSSLLVVILSLIRKNALWKVSRFDIYCGLISLMALFLYIVTHNLSVSILFAIIADCLAYIPTIV